MMTDDNRQTVLIVDDTALNIKVLNEILQTDYRVLFATGGEDALAAVNEAIPDIILLDIMMPEMDGYEVCRRLKEKPALKDIPVIFVTALDQADNETHGLELGAVDYITKPFNPGIIKLRVRNHLELKRQHDILSRLSMIDGLTGIPNRRRFDEYLDQEWKREIRSCNPISLVMIDIDFFKLFNDHYGHIEGDKCLKMVADALVESLQRPADMVARYGGEEFVAVLPETDESGVLLVAERFQESINSLGIPHESSSAAATVTISCGAATVRPCNEVSIDDLIRQADKSLYEAKQNGRNQIKVNSF